MSFPKYEAYKDSGVDQLGPIPSQWIVSRLGFESWIRARLGWKGLKAEEYVDEGYIFLSTPNIKGRDIDFENVNYINQLRFDESPEIKLREGDVLLVKDGSTLGIANFVRTLPHSTTVNSSIAVITPHEHLDGLYLKYLFESTFLQNTIQTFKGGMGVPHLFQSDLNKFYITLPKIEEQTQIARFLDHETARIDALIAEQQRLIELLKEKRQAVISHAVTKGLDPTVPMKDSGVEWLGEVPAHWGIKKFGNISVVVRGSSPRPAGDPELFNGDYSPWVTVAEITKDEEIYLSETETCLTKQGSFLSRTFTQGTLLLSNSGATLGVPKILQMDANANDGVVGFEQLQLNHEFAYFYLSTLTKDLRERIKQGSGQPNLNIDLVKSIPVPIPPADEVTEIVSFVIKTRARMSSLTQEAEEGIQLLQERRSALISAAVTGKIDVRGWQAPASTAPAPTSAIAQG